MPVQMWRLLIGPGADLLFDAMSPEAMGSLGGWGGRETLKWVHPSEFALRISEVSGVMRCDVI